MYKAVSTQCLIGKLLCLPGRYPYSVAAHHMALVVFGQLVHIVARELVLDSRENLLLEGIGEVWHA